MKLFEDDLSDPLRNLAEDLREAYLNHPVGVEGGAVVGAGLAAFAFFPGTCWGLVTEYPFRAACALTLIGAAWVIRWEIRERRIGRWFRTHLIRWWAPNPHDPTDGEWQWSDGQPRPVGRSMATEIHQTWRAAMEDQPHADLWLGSGSKS